MKIDVLMEPSVALMMENREEAARFLHDPISRPADLYSHASYSRKQ